MVVLSVSARRQQTTIRGARAAAPAAPSATVEASTADTLSSNLDKVAMAGYDKPLTATRETLHLTNLTSGDTITSVALEITYLDRQGRQLHKRRVTIYETVPPGETQLVSFPSWDKQHSFYYIKSAEPRRQATPYTVQVIPLFVTVGRP